MKVDIFANVVHIDGHACAAYINYVAVCGAFTAFIINTVYVNIIVNI